jgi:hypothetical protein
MKTLYAFGCSLIYGSELADVNQSPLVPSGLTFTALAAKKLNYNYKCIAKPGASNTAMARRITNYADKISPGLVFVLWTYPTRFEFKFNYPTGYGVKLNISSWLSILPMHNKTSVDFINEFYKHTGSNSDFGMYTTIQSVLLAQTILEKTQIPYIFACADTEMLQTIKSKSHSNFNVNAILQYIDTTKFLDQNLGFTRWANENNYKIGDGNHPLEEAHEDYSKFLVDQLPKITD